MSREAWETVLDTLELELTRTTSTAWSVPTGLGPVPRELVGRASRLLAAQRDRIAVLEAERRATAGHLGALRSVSDTREPRGSVYLDASA